MKGYLNKHQLNYLFYHLSFHLEEDTFRWVRSKFFFQEFHFPSPDDEGSIVFCLSPYELKEDNIINIEGLPVLFPIYKKNSFYTLEGQNLIFHHDILKSAFYLLSGFQEYHSDEKDLLGRFPYKASIQYRLGIIHLPLVNYYFEILIRGFESFCRVHNIDFKRKMFFDHWKVMLTHDIDKINTFSLYELAYKFKELAGISKSKYSKGHQFWLTLKYLWGFITQRWNNPHWDFRWLRAKEKYYGFDSVFYFLRNETLHADSYYQYEDSRIKKLLVELTQDNCEIGIHGPYHSADDFSSMQESLSRLSQNSPQKIAGIRQHMLRYEHPTTLLIQEGVGIKYDTSLGFAEHEGFRNSYCHPFKLYNFEADRIINVWEIPLIVMDSTLFEYRGLSVAEATGIMQRLVQEVKRFGGIFTLLWHNGYGTDHPSGKIRHFYTRLLNLFSSYHAQSILGKDLVKSIEKNKIPF